MSIPAINASHAYEPLSSSRREIRLLTLQQNEPELSCRLIRVALDDKPAYEALSYCWGRSDVHLVRILLDDQPFYITGNLAAALTTMRAKQPERKLWVDAICINQNNIDERNQQVKLMRDIYSSCDRVIVWIRQWQSARAMNPRLFLSGDSLLGRFGATKISKIEAGEEAPSEFMKGFLAGYFISRTVMDMPWFGRAWIVQEITVCTHAKFLINELELSWTTVESVLQSMNDMGHSAAALQRLCYQREAYTSGSRDTRDLLDIVICHRASQSTDLRDKIFAFVGIAEPGKRFGIEADYSKPVDVVFTEFTVKCIEHRNNLDILSATTSVTLKETPLPSWAFSPMYDKQHDVQWQSTLVCCDRKKQLSACRSCPCEWTVSAGSGTLYLEGFHFDTISEIKHCFPFWQGLVYSHTLRMIPWIRYLSTVACCVDMLKCYCNWRQVLSANDKTTYTLTKEPFRRVFWQAFCCRTDQKSLSESIQTLESFDALIRLFWSSPSCLQQSSIWVYTLLLFHIPVLWLRYFTVVRHLLQLSSMAWNRRLFVTQSGALGLGPSQIALGDELVIFKGAKVPLILRRFPGGDTWNLVGEAYVHGIMYGEVFEEANCSTYAIV